jgi:hypothetical protein
MYADEEVDAYTGRQTGTEVCSRIYHPIVICVLNFSLVRWAVSHEVYFSLVRWSVSHEVYFSVV